MDASGVHKFIFDKMHLFSERRARLEISRECYHPIIVILDFFRMEIPLFNV